MTLVEKDTKRRIVPLVSAVIAARDAELCLARAIDSALSQNHSCLEVIVVDDSSRDGTYDVARRYGEPVRVLRTERPLGPGGARNMAILAAKGDYLAFLDADDEWLPEKTARQLALIGFDAEMSFVYGRYAMIPSGGGVVSPPTETFRAISGRDAWKALLARPCIGMPTVLARRDAVIRAGLFDALLQTAEDQDLWIRLARLGSVGLVDEILACVHDTPDSQSKRFPREGILNTMSVVERHLASAAGELSSQEIREIRAARCARLGRNAYDAGEIALAARLLARSVRYGQPASATLAYVIAASRWGRLMKSRFA